MDLTAVGVSRYVGEVVEAGDGAVIKTAPESFVVREVTAAGICVLGPLIDVEAFGRGRAIFEALPETAGKAERSAIYDVARHFPFRGLRTEGEKLVPCESGKDVFRCTLMKYNLNTQDACRIIARRLGIPQQAVQFGGTKDKFAVTFQEISVHCRFEDLFNYALSLYNFHKSEERADQVLTSVDGEKAGDEQRNTTSTLSETTKQPAESVAAAPSACSGNMQSDKHTSLRLFRQEFGATDIIRKENERACAALAEYMEIASATATDRLLLCNIRKGGVVQLGSNLGNHFNVSVRYKQPFVKDEGSSLPIAACHSALLARVAQKDALGSPALLFYNYFGHQRFGQRLNNHEVGQLILEGKNDAALDAILSCSDATIGKSTPSRLEHFIATSRARGVPAKTIVARMDRLSRMLYMHAFQSFLFNQAVNARVEAGQPFPEDRVMLPDGSFAPATPETPLCEIYIPLERRNDKYLKGGYRRLCERIEDLCVTEISEHTATGECISGVRIQFKLAKSAYATVALRELLGSFVTGREESLEG